MDDDLSKLREATGPGPLPPPASPEEVERFEAASGLRLPPWLRSVYLAVANGGFGRGYGLCPLLPGGAAESGESALELYQEFRRPDPDDPGWSWPAHLLPICDWGCAIRSCVSCRSEKGAVVRFDPNVPGPGESWRSAFTRECPTVRAWLLEWATGR
jgi:SMI1 / KNR4 family (SUKH-1)